MRWPRSSKRRQHGNAGSCCAGSSPGGYHLYSSSGSAKWSMRTYVKHGGRSSCSTSSSDSSVLVQFSLSQFFSLSSVQRSMSSVHRSLHHIHLQTQQTTSTPWFMVRCLISCKSQRRTRELWALFLCRQFWSTVAWMLPTCSLFRCVIYFIYFICFSSSSQVSALCNSVSGSVSPWVQLTLANMTDLNAQYHDFHAVTNDSCPNWYFESMTIMHWNNHVGYMGYTPQEISSMANSGYSLGIYDSLIYNLTDYVNYGPSGEQAPTSMDDQFMDSSVINLFKYSSGQDLTKAIDNLNIDAGTLTAQKMCLRNLFLIGMVDNRNPPQCLFSQYILLALLIMMVSIIMFKFIASINFGSPCVPEDHNKFVICQVPCYTEGETSLRQTFDLFAQLKHDDKHKMIHVICVGNIVGSGNDQPTPCIMLGILGVDPNLDPELLSFISLGKGAQQHNMGKVYCTLGCTSARVTSCLISWLSRSASWRRDHALATEESETRKWSLCTFWTRYVRACVTMQCSSSHARCTSTPLWTCWSWIYITRSRMWLVSTRHFTSICLWLMPIPLWAHSLWTDWYPHMSCPAFFIVIVVHSHSSSFLAWFMTRRCLVFMVRQHFPMSSSPSSQWCRSTSTSTLTTWPKLLSRSLVPLPVYPVVSHFTISIQPTHTSLCWSLTRWSQTTLRIALTRCTWRTCCISERIVNWRHSYWNISRCTKRSLSEMPMHIWSHWMTGRSCFHNDVVGSTGWSTTWKNWCS